MKQNNEGYFSNLELVELATYCQNESQLLEVSTWLRWLWALGENINLELFRKLAERRWQAIYEPKN